MTADLAQLKEDARKAKALYDQAEDRYNAALIKAAPFKVGDVVVVNGSGYRVEKHRVQITDVRTSWNSVVYYGAKFKKNGELYANSNRLYGPLVKED